jgi:hypothetical protein
MRSRSPILFITGYVDKTALEEVDDARIIKKPFVGENSQTGCMLRSPRLAVARAERSSRLIDSIVVRCLLISGDYGTKFPEEFAGGATFGEPQIQSKVLRLLRPQVWPLGDV